MARSKNLHIVRHEVNITQPSSAQANWAEGVIQVDVGLSKKLGRSVRNGNSFRLVGYQSTLRGYDAGGDLDTGFAGVTTIQYCPTTHYGVKAWNGLQKQWFKQKQLASAAGSNVRYDDFEVGWDTNDLLPGNRTSVMRMTGLTDSSSESVVLYGNSLDGAYVTLQGYWDGLQEPASASYDPFGIIIKNPKFTKEFPQFTDLPMAATFSAGVDTATTPDSLHSAVAMDQFNWLPSDNHISHMTGTLKFYFKGVAPDTGAANADHLKLVILLVYEGWSSLMIKPKRSTRSRTRSKRSYKKTYNKRRNYYGKR